MTAAPIPALGLLPDWLIPTLRKQAKEIALEGYYGWGNTMTAAADALATALRLREACEGLEMQLRHDATPIMDKADVVRMAIVDDLARILEEGE